MTLFDLLFLALVLASVATLIAAAVAAFRGRRSQSLKILRRLDPWCFDDWCLSVETVTQRPAGSGTAYTVSLRLFSQARRVSQRALGAWIYVIDQKGNRYAPKPDRSTVPLDVLLGPGEASLHLLRSKIACARCG